MNGDGPNKSGFISGLSTKLFALIILVILAVEVVIFLPSMANARAGWLDDRLSVGAVALQVLDAVPDDMELSADLTDSLLTLAGAQAIALRHGGQSHLIERKDDPMPMAALTVDMRYRDPMTLIMGGLDTLFSDGERTLRIVGQMGDQPDMQIEILMPEAPLREELLTYSRNIFFLSLVIATFTAAVLFLFVEFSLIRPIRRITQNIMVFRGAPENASLIASPTTRNDEIGWAEHELAQMESEMFSMLRQRRHLADLGLAVAKINHDLRNTLTSAQLLSDQVATLDDPQVQRLAPRLVHTLDKAIGFAQSVLDYGRESATPPKPQPVDLRALIEECIFDAGLAGHPDIEAENTVPDGITVKVDPDQMARVLVNLIKNAREALETVADGDKALKISVGFTQQNGDFTISVTDNGPGLPPRAKQNLFVAFEGSARAGGTGLGLAIARELTEAHGGQLRYVDSEEGTRFDVQLPAMRRLA